MWPDTILAFVVVWSVLCAGLGVLGVVVDAVERMLRSANDDHVLANQHPDGDWWDEGWD